MLEIRIHGRGGQGAQVACQLLASAFFRLGDEVQAFAAYGGERRGAPRRARAEHGAHDAIEARLDLVALNTYGLGESIGSGVPCACGRTLVRIGRITMRTDDMVIAQQGQGQTRGGPAPSGTTSQWPNTSATAMRSHP
jgi:hypothetical protein